MLNIVGYAMYDFRMNGYNNHLFIFLATFIAFLSLVFYISSPRKRFEFAGTVIVLFGILWISKGFTQLFFADFILWLLYTIARRELVVKIDREGVVYPSFPSRKITWQQINNVILKDDILTIDLKTNKVYQPFVRYAGEEISEEVFNEFCKQQMI